MNMRLNLLPAVSAFALLGACATGYNTTGMAPVERIADHLTTTGADRAQMLAANGNFEAAAALYQTQVDADPANAELKHRLAETYRLAGNASRSRAVFLEIVTVEGWQARGFEGLGRVAVTAGDPAGAQQAFESATAADPWAWRSWLALAQLSDFEANWEQADAHYAAALGATKEPAIVYNNLGISFMARGNPEYAAHLFSQALQHDPTLAKARTNLDLAEAAAGKTTPASGSADSRDQARRLNNFAYVAEMQDRREDALRLYEAAIQQHPAFYAKAFNRLTELKRSPLQAEKKIAPPALPISAPLTSEPAPEVAVGEVPDNAGGAAVDTGEPAIAKSEPLP
jgi:Flp pilus assembly protein TadD